MYRFEPPPTPQFGGGSEPEDPYAGSRAPSAHPSTPRRAHPASRPPAPPAAGPPPRATTALVLGVLSVCGVAVLGPLAWVTAHRALREIDRSPRPARTRWQFVVAQALGVVGTCVLALWAMGFAAVLVLSGALG